jgi:hypothetical protein
MDIVTKADLEAFRKQMLADIRTILREELVIRKEDSVQGFKTTHVRKILGCSVNTLVALRVARKIRWKKIGGTIYYNKEDVRQLVEDGF